MGVHSEPAGVQNDAEKFGRELMDGERRTTKHGIVRKLNRDKYYFKNLQSWMAEL